MLTSAGTSTDRSEVWPPCNAMPGQQATSETRAPEGTVFKQASWPQKLLSTGHLSNLGTTHDEAVVKQLPAQPNHGSHAASSVQCHA